MKDAKFLIFLQKIKNFASFIPKSPSFLIHSISNRNKYEKDFNNHFDALCFRNAIERGLSPYPDG
jgi:hypothetical protein